MAINLLKNISPRKGKLAALAMLLLPPFLTAQTAGTGPIGAALAGSTTARVESPWLFSSNPATLTAVRERIALASLSPAALGIDGYVDGCAAAIVPVDSSWTVATGVSGLGARGYRELSAGVAGGVRPVPQLSIGVAVGIGWLAIDRYGSAVAAPTIDVGMLAEITERIRLGAAASNVTATSLAGSDLPQRIALGLACDVDSTATLSLDLTHELRRSPTASLALSIAPLPWLIFRGGAAHDPATIALGFGCSVGGVTFDYGGAYVAPLGLRHAVGVSGTW